jgi:hypothetical protein
MTFNDPSGDEPSRKTKQQRIDEIIADLSSRNERQIIGALKRIPHEGSPLMMEALFNLYAQSPSKEVVILLEKVVHNLKDAACIMPMLDMLEHSKYAKIHAPILASFWQSGLDVSEHLEALINVAIGGDFLTVMEALTVIENLEFSNDDAITKSIQLMDKAVEIKSEKQTLLVELRQVLLDKLLGER